MSAVKSFIKTYGFVGVSVYGSVTAVSISSIYLALRTGGGDTMITAPLEGVLGKDSDVVRKIKQQLGEAQQQQTSTGAVKGGENKASDREINFVREGVYLGIASILDSLALPLKLVLCLPITKHIIKRRGR